MVVIVVIIVIKVFVNILVLIQISISFLLSQTINTFLFKIYLMLIIHYLTLCNAIQYIILIYGHFIFKPSIFYNEFLRWRLLWWQFRYANFPLILLIWYFLHFISILTKNRWNTYQEYPRIGIYRLEWMYHLCYLVKVIYKDYLKEGENTTDVVLQDACRLPNNPLL